jgi:predicted transcriptional regulator
LFGGLVARYRDRLQIIADILSIASGGAKKTRIMYRANLSYRLLCRYLREVVMAGLVRRGDGDCYVITAKGREFLKRHREYLSHWRSLEGHLRNVKNERMVLEKMCSIETA